MVYWLIPICFFALFGSIFLGGTSIEPQGGTGLRQVLGLLVSAAIHVALWNVLRIALATFLPDTASLAFATLLSIPGVLVAAWIGFIIFGVKLGKAAPVH